MTVMGRHPDAATTPKARASATSIADLTRVVFGSELSMAEAWEHLQSEPLQAPPSEPRSVQSESAAIWVGSIGYERFRDVRDFVRKLVAASVERLVDVRELPISRRRGYAKTALTAAAESAGIEYLHVRALGNPKELRDLYKSGDLEQGRKRYERYLLTEQRQALADLEGILREKRSALMCLEHDQGTCHRDVILASLQRELGVTLRVAPLA